MHTGEPVGEVSAAGPVFTEGSLLPADLSVWAGGSAAPPTAADSGLPVDANGQVPVDEFLRACDRPDITVDERLTALIADQQLLAVTEPVIMELSAGARAQDGEDALRSLLLRCKLLHFDSVTDFDAAVRIYRRCRAAGITPRGLLDCMIAAVAWRRSATLLSNDVDLDRVARVIGLELDDASLRA